MGHKSQRIEADELARRLAAQSDRELKPGERTIAYLTRRGRTKSPEELEAERQRAEEFAEGCRLLLGQFAERMLDAGGRGAEPLSLRGEIIPAWPVYRWTTPRTRYVGRVSSYGDGLDNSYETYGVFFRKIYIAADGRVFEGGEGPKGVKESRLPSGWNTLEIVGSKLDEAYDRLTSP